jgi:hypothetical protein
MGNLPRYRPKLVPDEKLVTPEEAEAAAKTEAEEKKTDAEEKKTKKQIDVLVEAASTGNLFHDGDNAAYADLMIDGHRETWPVRSDHFKRWLTRQFWERMKTAPASEALNSALRTIEAMASFNGEERQVFLRVDCANLLTSRTLPTLYWWSPGCWRPYAAVDPIRCCPFGARPVRPNRRC